MISEKLRRRIKRKKRIRGKISGSATRPRVSVYRSHCYFYAQLIDDEAGHTLTSIMSNKAQASELKRSVEDVSKLGEMWSKQIQAKGVKSVVFDCNGFRYHGLIASFADGLRKGGLQL